MSHASQADQTELEAILALVSDSKQSLKARARALHDCIPSLSSENREMLVQRIHTMVSRLWAEDNRAALQISYFNLLIGRLLNEPRYLAYGMMGQGDSLKNLQFYEAAWRRLDRAGALFLASGDEEGWARTRIGRLYISFNLARCEEALQDFPRAVEIFERHANYTKLIDLLQNAGKAYQDQGDARQALTMKLRALDWATRHKDKVQINFGVLYNNIGTAYMDCGDLEEAKAYYEKARALFEANRQVIYVSVILQNIAHVESALGRYRAALETPYRLLDTVFANVGQHQPREMIYARLTQIGAYRRLGCYSQARQWAHQVIEMLRALPDFQQEKAFALLGLADACTALARVEPSRQAEHLAEANAALAEAEQIFGERGAPTRQASVWLRKGDVALQQKRYAAAIESAQAAQAWFSEQNLRAEWVEAVLLEAQALAAQRTEPERAVQRAQDVLTAAKSLGDPALQYSAYLLLGKTAEADARYSEAILYYRAAADRVESLQHDLTVALRHEFLRDKIEALRALIRLYIQLNLIEEAFETLERAKSQIFMNYLLNPDALRWPQDEEYSQALIDDFNRLMMTVTSADGEQSEIERETIIQQVLGIRERLYLQSRSAPATQILQEVQPRLTDIQRALPPDALLIEYYHDGRTHYAFVLDRERLSLHTLPITGPEISAAWEQFKQNMDAALARQADDAFNDGLGRQARQILAKLYTRLLAPLEERLHARDYRQVIIVPHGQLHYVPFNLLYRAEQKRYLIEDYEVVIWPVATQTRLPKQEKAPGALALGYSDGKTIPGALDEAGIVYDCFKGALRVEGDATAERLRVAPRQILHIAAHGVYNIRHPELSYLILADGRLLIDSLLQIPQGLGYSLVTLSGCETGLAHVTEADELIGLGRGFLYKGADTVVASLWRVPDRQTVPLMETFYRALSSGESKAAALRKAQRERIEARRTMHPAFWGAFQLVGDASPL